MENRKYIWLLLVVLILLGLGALFLGRYTLEPSEVIAMLLDHSYEGLSKSSKVVLFNIRLPRVLTAIWVGAALAVSGATYQSTFMNPMVSPNLLGVTSGAGFGASLAILLGLDQYMVQVFAFVFGILTVGLTYGISHHLSKKFSTGIVTMILSGMVIGSLFNAFISLAKFLADPNASLPEITFWLMGSLSGVSIKDFYFVAIPIAIGVIPLILLRWKLNMLALGDDDAKAMGVSTSKLRLVLVISSTMIVSAGVSLCGIIGWIGVVIPHIARLLVGSDNRYLIPVSLLIGGGYLLIIDTLARVMLPVEIPLSILTAIIGAPFFIYLMMGKKEVWR